MNGIQPPSPDDYLAPPHNTEHNDEIRRTHTVLALICALSLPLFGCSILYGDDQGAGGEIATLIHLGLVAVTFSVPFFALGRSKGCAVQPNLALWISGLFIACVGFMVWRVFSE